MNQEALWWEEAPAADPGPQPFATWVPDWLWAAAGWLNPVRLSPLAKLEPCQRCHEPILRAQDGTVQEAFQLRVDPRLLTPAAELEEVLAGRLTVELATSAGPRPPRLYSRDQWRMADTPGRPRPLVVPTHGCGRITGVELPWEMIYPQTYRMTKSHGENGLAEPPF